MRFLQSRRSLAVFAPAKVNLFLEILGKRTDGYHDLETVMVTIGIYDTLTFREDDSGRIRLRCFEGSPAGSNASLRLGLLPDGAENLVVRAAELLRNHAGVTRGVRIDLTKRIPLAAGLAGGSSNAAATLLALNRLWDLGLSRDELATLAVELGSDIAFFLYPTPAAICRGRGEIVEPLRLPAALDFVIACPATGLSTATVYQHCRPAERPRSGGVLAECLKRGRLGKAAGLLYNALQPVAERLNADVSELRNRFSREAVLGHMMSGSGTAYFGLCGNRRQARRIAARWQTGRFARVFVARSEP